MIRFLEASTKAVSFMFLSLNPLPIDHNAHPIKINRLCAYLQN